MLGTEPLRTGLGRFVFGFEHENIFKQVRIIAHSIDTNDVEQRVCE